MSAIRRRPLRRLKSNERFTGARPSGLRGCCTLDTRPQHPSPLSKSVLRPGLQVIQIPWQPTISDDLFMARATTSEAEVDLSLEVSLSPSPDNQRSPHDSAYRTARLPENATGASVAPVQQLLNRAHDDTSFNRVETTPDRDENDSNVDTSAELSSSPTSLGSPPPAPLNVDPSADLSSSLTSSSTSPPAPDEFVNVDTLLPLSPSPSDVVTSFFECGCARHTRFKNPVRQWLAFHDGELDGDGLLELAHAFSWLAKHLPMSLDMAQKVAPCKANLRTSGTMVVRLRGLVVEGASDNGSAGLVPAYLDILQTSAFSYWFEAIAEDLQTEEALTQQMTLLLTSVLRRLRRAGVRAGVQTGDTIFKSPITVLSNVRVGWPFRNGRPSSTTNGELDLCISRAHGTRSKDILFIAEHKLMERSAHEIMPQLITYMAMLTEDPAADEFRPSVTLNGVAGCRVLPAMLQTGTHASLVIAWRDRGLEGSSGFSVYVGRRYDLLIDTERSEFLTSLGAVLLGTAQLTGVGLSPSYDGQEYREVAAASTMDPCSLPASFLDKIFLDDAETQLLSSSPEPADDEEKDPSVRLSDLDDSDDSNDDGDEKKSSRKRRVNDDHETKYKRRRRVHDGRAEMRRQARAKRLEAQARESSIGLIKKAAQNRHRLMEWHGSGIKNRSTQTVQ
ncbi:hypothetical protein PYCC9005_004406 [Savitreella phatthalungensis]